MHLDLVRRVRPQSRSPKKKKANRRRSVSHHVPKVFTPLGRLHLSELLCASLLKVCATIRPFFSSRTICGFREIFYLSRMSRPVLYVWSCRPFTKNLKEIVMKLRILSLVFAAVMFASLSASAATVSSCCGEPACCNGGSCC